MGPSRIRRALGKVKDQTSIGLARVGSSNSLSDLDVAIVKATRHEEQPAEEKYVREILSLTSYSRAYVTACVASVSRRLCKTRTWTVALKSLLLLYRLASDGDPAYGHEIFFATHHGGRLLNLSNFRDTSRSNSWDFSAFVRTFALYLDQKLEFRMHGLKEVRRLRRRGSSVTVVGDDAEEEDGRFASFSLSLTTTKMVIKPTPIRDMPTDQIFDRVHNLQQLLERFLACRPTGISKNNRVVIVALYPLVKESFQVYCDMADMVGVLIDRFMEMEIQDCETVYEIFIRATKQFDDLDMFYGWCKSIGMARSSEYPNVEKITQMKLDIMNNYIRDKSAALAQSRMAKNSQDAQKAADVAEVEDPQNELTGIKALPAPQQDDAAPETSSIQEGDQKKATKGQPEGDLLNLMDDDVGAATSEEQGNKMALALFDGPPTPAEPAWEAFTSNKEETSDWETALVVSASNLSKQKASLGGGFDMSLLNNMYQQQTMQPGMSTAYAMGTGSSSSVAFPTTPSSGMLSLPVPPGLAGQGGVGGDPFAASAAVPPPAYVKMSEIEKKRRLLVEEQLMWERYTMEGMQGHLPGVRMVQPSPYPGPSPSPNMGGYQQSVFWG